MIELEQSPSGAHLRIQGRRVRRDEDGNYIVRYDRIRHEDLSAVPAGTSIILDHGERFRKESDFIALHRIEILSSTRVRAFCDHFRCPECWDHALGWGAYMTMAENILVSPAAQSAGVRFEGVVLSDPDHPYQMMSVEVPSADPASVFKSAAEVVKPLLAPLTDFLIRVDLEAEQLL